jgi:regulator of RNase E activity RraA
MHRITANNLLSMLYADVYARPGPDENHYALEIGLVDDLNPSEIVVAACGKTGRIAPWGGLLSTAATVRGTASAVMDGFVHDIKHVRDLKLPVYSGGIAPLDSMGRGKAIEVDMPVECAGVLVHPGDIVLKTQTGASSFERLWNKLSWRLVVKNWRLKASHWMH